jgi:regulator of RNase E activity RraA
MKRILEIPGPRVMVIQDLDEPFGAAVFGEVMATSYRAFGCVGMVTNGYGRDINQIRHLEFPCFASGICVSHGYSRLIEFNVPVDVGGVRIQPGDLIHGDADGITTIPIEIAEDVAGACEGFMEAEGIIIGRAKEHPEDVAAYQKALDACHAKMRDIAAGIKYKGKGSPGQALA